MHLQNQHLGINKHDRGRKAQLPHRQQIIVFGEGRAAAKEPEHAEVDDDGFGGREEHPCDIFFDVEAAVFLALGVEFGDGEEG